MTDPFYMHPNDNERLAIVSLPLNNANYNDWSRFVQLALRSKNKLEFINETLIHSETPNSSLLAWGRYNNNVMARLTNSMEAEITESIL